MTAQSNIITDLSAYTKVPNKALTELVKKSELCIGSAIHDALLANQEAVVLNIGIGTLSIELSSMQCKFIPNKELKTVIKRCIAEKIDPVEYEIERALIEKITTLCSEVL